MRAILFVLILVGAFSMESCKEVHDDIPPAGVWIVFPYQHDWEKWGVTSIPDHKEFILSEGLPKGFNYSAAAQTGFGGVLLVADLNGAPAAYDLSCPVEKSQNVRIRYDDDRHIAVCDKCGSEFDVITNYGNPLSGPAKDDNYVRVLRKYNIATGPNGEYRVIRP